MSVTMDLSRSYSMPSYDLENQFVVRFDPRRHSDLILCDQSKSSKDSVPLQDEQNSSDMDKHDSNESKTNEKARRIIDGKYETYYNQDDFLINVHTIIEEITFERMILDVETGVIRRSFFSQ